MEERRRRCSGSASERRHSRGGDQHAGKRKPPAPPPFQLNGRVELRSTESRKCTYPCATNFANARQVS